MAPTLVASDSTSKPHAVCIPFPAQGHINPMLKLAKLLHHKGFHITFVNTEFNHRRLLKSRGSDALQGLPSFRFETIPDGLPPSDPDSTQDIPALLESASKNFLQPFRDLVSRLNGSGSDGVPPVTCIVSDGSTCFSLDLSEELGIPNAVFWTASASGLMGFNCYRQIVDKGLAPLKDSSCFTNGYLNTTIDWIPEMQNVRLKDLPSFLRTTNPDDFVLNYAITVMDRLRKEPTTIILNTFDALEHQDLLDTLSSSFPKIYTIGPVHLLENQIDDQDDLKSLESNLWKEEPECLVWLGSQEPDSVVYVNFGSITVMTPHQMVEFAWGLANTNRSFLWIIRPDLVVGDSAILPPEFVNETKGRGFLASWCPQEKVLNHPSIGWFLTHCGWNSTLESICAGVPMICWPFFAEQPTNCWVCCNRLGIGMEIDSDVKRDDIAKLVLELMVGEKGKEMKKNVMKLKKLAEEAISVNGGSSNTNFEELVTVTLDSASKFTLS